nr:MAG TPA: hypothetical protein [Bacteriophage sp.]
MQYPYICAIIQLLYMGSASFEILYVLFPIKLYFNSKKG